MSCESNSQGERCNRDDRGSCLFGSVCICDVDFDCKGSLVVVGVGLSVRISCTACNVRGSIAKVPGERVRCGVTCCLSSEANRCSYCSGCRSSCESERQRCSGNCDR